MHASAGMMVHFAIADAAGHSVVVEYIGNEMVVTETPVVTNYYLSPGEKYGIGTEESKIRYAMLDDMLQSGFPFSMDGIRDAILILILRLRSGALSIIRVPGRHAITIGKTTRNIIPLWQAVPEKAVLV